MGTQSRGKMVLSLKGEVWPWPGCIYPEEGGPALIEEMSSCMWKAWPCLRTPKLSGGYPVCPGGI